MTAKTSTTETKTNILDGLTKDAVAKMKPEEQAKVRNSLLNKAGTILKERHPNEYEEIAAGLFAELGLERNRRLTPLERKMKEMQDLAAELGFSLTPATAESASA